MRLDRTASIRSFARASAGPSGSAASQSQSSYVKAAHLTILRALAGLGPIAGDPYAVDGIPRPVAKRWALEAISRGKPIVRRSPRAPAKVQKHDPKAVGMAMVAAHPCLADPSAVVPRDLADRLGGDPAPLL